jgi:uncharacterized membrane protein
VPSDVIASLSGVDVATAMIRSKPDEPLAYYALYRALDRRVHYRDRYRATHALFSAGTTLMGVGVSTFLSKGDREYRDPRNTALIAMMSTALRRLSVAPGDAELSLTVGIAAVLYYKRRLMQWHEEPQWKRIADKAFRHVIVLTSERSVAADALIGLARIASSETVRAKYVDMARRLQRMDEMASSWWNTDIKDERSIHRRAFDIVGYVAKQQTRRATESARMAADFAADARHGYAQTDTSNAAGSVLGRFVHEAVDAAREAARHTKETPNA